jgi:putative transposase
MILSDNGTPFSSNSVKRLCKLSVWWMRLGIRPRLTQPGKPQQNGRHERMHRDLKAVACRKPAANAAEQQKSFDRFVDRYNFVRPHESLGQTPPNRSYAQSPRPFPEHLPALEYPSSHQVRRVRSSGEIKWAGQWLFVSEALVGELVSFEIVGDGCSILRFGSLELGFYSERDKRLHLDRVRPDGKAENK